LGNVVWHAPGQPSNNLSRCDGLGVSLLLLLDIIDCFLAAAEGLELR
jgi:hypothetical protein